ncbi:hypothetical protein NEOLI_004027 [Neolecta irregularis DAH-3]|uniref:YTH domain-containing protein n=1 Tax=Neolecta irregularis (strain DAH-3) TaxID=1198029 RepID=A0A1U7LSA2_NEOID|nr:hypothetical protein NEOLI_004027 [Neolecta irregularis DAH-3]|eukprot:OLL25524.1 hypothetical protein NEOLI_004027 [Neolecta irregularis DAH-3]
MTEHQTAQVQQQQYFSYPYPFGFQSVFAQPNIPQAYQASATTSHANPTVYVAISPPRVMSPLRLTSPPPIVMSPPPMAYSPPVNIPPKFIYQTPSAQQTYQQASYGPGKPTGYINGHPTYGNGVYTYNQPTVYQHSQATNAYTQGNTNPTTSLNVTAPQFVYNCQQPSLAQSQINSSQPTQIHPFSSNNTLDISTTAPSIYTPASADIPVYTSDGYTPHPTVTRSTAPTSVSEDIRGPPQKPRQTGYALWVGNLAQDISLIELKDHFADVEVFATTRLVCRLRRSQKPQEKPMISTPEQIALKIRFFILKSLSKEDLLVSVRTRKWSTQPHNQQLLNEAFEA